MQAMEKSFLSCEDPAAPGELEELLGLVERKMEQDKIRSVGGNSGQGRRSSDGERTF